MLKKLATGLAGLTLLLSQASLAAEKRRVAVSGDSFIEFTEMGEYGGNVGEYRDRFGIYTPLATHGYGFDVRAGFFLGKGYVVEAEFEGNSRISKLEGRSIGLADAFRTSLEEYEFRGELWANGIREFKPFKDASTIYLGLGLGLVVEHVSLLMNYASESDPDVKDAFVFRGWGAAPAGKVLLGGSMQLYKFLFLNLRSSFKFTNVSLHVKEETNHKDPLFPEKMHKSLREFDVGLGLEVRF